jgi:uncharacterized protein
LRTITLEEHFVTPKYMAGPGRDMPKMLDSYARATQQASGSMLIEQMLSLGERRISEMDAAGIDMQVLSMTRGVAEVQNEDEALEIVRNSNDLLADAVRQHPNRLAGFALLPVLMPEKAVDELERTVKEHRFKGAMIHGHSLGRYLDDRFFWPILARAEELGVPIYIHPTPPPDPVIQASYVGNYSPEVMRLFSIAGWGWHVETALHVLRIILSGAFDTYPKLQIVIGHLGECLPFMMPRIDRIFPTLITKLNRPVGAYFRENVHYTFGGFNYTPAFLDLLLQVGSDRIMFSADYPFASMSEAKNFMNQLPVSPKEKEQIAHGNAERLLKL